MRHRWNVLLLMALSVSLAGCKQSSQTPTDGSVTTADSLVGAYAVKTQNDIAPMLKVTGSAPTYSVSIQEGGRWVEVPGARSMTQQDFDRLFGGGRPVPAGFSGVQAGGHAIVHVPSGWHNGQMQTKTGWLLVGPFSTLQAEKL